MGTEKNKIKPFDLLYWCCVFSNKTLGDDAFVAGLYCGERMVRCVFNFKNY